MIRIAMLLASDGNAIGGMEKQVALQANYLQRTPSVEIHVLAHEAYAHLFDAPIIFHALHSRRSRNSLKLLWDTAIQIRRIAPDIVHAHGDKASTLLSRIRLALPTAKRVATVHGTKRASTALGSMDRIFAVSEGVREALHPLPSCTIGNAIEGYQGHRLDKQALCQRFGLNPDWTLLIAAGRLAKVKRYDSLMRAFANLQANLLIFGEGPMRPTLQKLERDHIRLAGYMEPVQSAFAAADALIINSEREGLSLSMLEALQMGVPVISTPVSGAKELLPEACLLNPQQDLALQLAEKCRQPERLRQHSEPSFEKVNSHYAPDRVVARLLNYYHDVLENESA